MKRHIYSLLMLLAMGAASCDIIIKPDPEVITVNGDSVEVVVNVKVNGDTLTVKPEQKPVNIAQCDMVMLDKGKLYFYNSATQAMAPYEAETDSVVNSIFVGDKLYYCVPENGMIVLKSIQLDDPDPQPVKVVDWGLKYEKCVTETYGTVSPLYYDPIHNMLGLWHEFSWDSYALTQQRLYDIATGTLTDDWVKYGSDPGEDTFYEQLETADGQYWCKKDGKVCLSDKIDFNQYVSDPDYASEREYSFVSASPDQSRVLYGAILEWGDLPHGILALASTDGKIQIPLEDTDYTGFVAEWLKDGSLVYVGEEPLSPDDPDYNANWHYKTHCIKRIFPDGHTEIIGHCSDFQVK